MNGSTHKAIGFAAGASLAVYAMYTSQPLMALGIITAPVGAVLPDIDHHNTRLGRTKDAVFTLIKKVSRIVLVAAMVVAVLAAVITRMSAVMPICLITIFVGVFINIALSETLAKKMPFLTKHRGIMHTLLIPVVLAIASGVVQNVIVRSLIMGLAIGYITHLYADSLTVMGAPLVWPISQECVGLRLIRTGSAWECIAAAIMSVAMVMYAILVSRNTWYAALLLIVIIVPVCRTFIRKLLKTGKSQKSRTIKTMLVSAVAVTCLLLMVFCEMAVKILSGSILSGVLVGLWDAVKIRRK